jgi:hypothetical protein
LQPDQPSIMPEQSTLISDTTSYVT